jgi:hypothetical protein
MNSFEKRSDVHKVQLRLEKSKKIFLKIIVIPPSFFKNRRSKNTKSGTI